MPHRQQGRAIVAVHGGGRRVEQGRGGVYRHFSDRELLSSFHIRKRIIVISDSGAALSSFRLRLWGGGGAWRYRHSGFAFSSLWIRFFVRADSLRGKIAAKKLGFPRLSEHGEFP
jgi:hypothetical protein